MNASDTHLCIETALARGAHALAGHSDSPRLDAQLLLAAVLGRPRSALMADGARPLQPAQRREFDAFIARRLAGAPVAYMTGRREFWSLELTVTPAVLVPRPETETLVELALARLPTLEQCTVLDLGTGSGAIALAIAGERPLAEVIGTDVSAAAIEVAAANANRLGLRNVHWRLGSWFDALPDGRFDVIVSNPPYVAAGDPALAALCAEPALALTPGPSGLEAIAAIAAAAPRHLAAGGWILLEHGAAQGEAVAQLLVAHGFRHTRTHPDYAGRPRVTLAASSSPP
jgi:release factor glutamine methyltransferase